MLIPVLEPKNVKCPKKSYTHFYKKKFQNVRKKVTQKCNISKTGLEMTFRGKPDTAPIFIINDKNSHPANDG